MPFSDESMKSSRCRKGKQCPRNRVILNIHIFQIHLNVHGNGFSFVGVGIHWYIYIDILLHMNILLMMSND